MDLIHIILSVFLRLSPAALNMSGLSKSGKRRRNGTAELAMWLPLVGWVSVSVQFMPSAFWLPWRVYDVRSIDRSSLDSNPNQSWGKNSSKRGRPKPPQNDMPD